MALYYKTGDALAIARREHLHFGHGCNCWNTMGSGVAKQVKKQMYALWKADQATVRGDRSKLGGFSKAVFSWGTGYNLYTQYYYDRYKTVLQLHAFRESLTAVVCDILTTDPKALVIPKIGAGTAGGHWEQIEPIVTICADSIDIIVVSLP